MPIFSLVNSNLKLTFQHYPNILKILQFVLLEYIVGIWLDIYFGPGTHFLNQYIVSNQVHRSQVDQNICLKQTHNFSFIILTVKSSLPNWYKKRLKKLDLLRNKNQFEKVSILSLRNLISCFVHNTNQIQSAVLYQVLRKYVIEHCSNDIALFFP